MRCVYLVCIFLDEALSYSVNVDQHVTLFFTLDDPFGGMLFHKHFLNCFVLFCFWRSLVCLLVVFRRRHGVLTKTMTGCFCLFVSFLFFLTDQTFFIESPASPCCGLLKNWKFYLGADGDVTAMLWRPTTGANYELISTETFTGRCFLCILYINVIVMVNRSCYALVGHVLLTGLTSNPVWIPELEQVHCNPPFLTMTAIYCGDRAR